MLCSARADAVKPRIGGTGGKLFLGDGLNGVAGDAAGDAESHAGSKLNLPRFLSGAHVGKSELSGIDRFRGTSAGTF
eukprot:8044567-Pyramimonas_sp.AAC.1